MKNKSSCYKCLASEVCSPIIEINSHYCKVFHEALESKLQSHNTTKATISLDIVRTVLEKCFVTIGVDTLIHEMEKIAKQ